MGLERTGEVSFKLIGGEEGAIMRPAPYVPHYAEAYRDGTRKIIPTIFHDEILTEGCNVEGCPKRRATNNDRDQRAEV